MPIELKATLPLDEADTVELSYNPEPGRDYIRAAITITLLVALLGMIVYGFYSTHGDYTKSKEVLDKLLPAIIGLIGSALGFYFGSKSNQGT